MRADFQRGNTSQNLNAFLCAVKMHTSLSFRSKLMEAEFLRGTGTSIRYLVPSQLDLVANVSI